MGAVGVDAAAAESLRVGLDVTPVLAGLTGVARYTIGLELGLRARGVDVRAFGIGNGRGALGPSARHVKIPLRVMRRLWALHLPPRAESFTGPIDLLHSVDLDPPRCRVPVVSTIHDLAALEFPELHPPAAVAGASRRLRSLERAAAVLADSGATANALVRNGIERSRVTVVPLAPHPLPEARADEAGVPGPYLLAVGELTLRKDYPTLFRAFAQADLPDFRLVVVGPDGFGADEVHAAAAASGLGDRLVMVGYASDRRLSALYAGASALVLTTREEGFGLPLVEAMSRGLPIVASDIEVVAEVAGEAALRAPTGDAAAFAACLERVVRDPEARAAASTAGRQRSLTYTWDRTVDKTIEVYQRVAG